MRPYDDVRYMRMALEEARVARAQGEVPIGAVVVYDAARDPASPAFVSPEEPASAWGSAPDPQPVALGHNRREGDESPTAHAELLAMEGAARRLGHWRLSGCTVYVTLEPCLMCAGLMVNARVDRCVYGAPDPKAGALGSLYDVAHDARLNHTFDVTPGVLADDAAALLRDFFRARRTERRDARRAAGKPFPM